MRAVEITAPGQERNLRIIDAREPVPGAGEVLVDVAFCGCNFADTMIAKGTYPHPKGYPIIGGLEISGRVAALGPGVAGVNVGDRVAAFSEEAGGFADQCVVPAERLAPVPDGMGLDVAAAVTIQGLTAWHLLHNVSKTAPGDIVLIHAIGGGVGLLATQLAALAGATVIGTVGTRGKEKRALEFGAARVVNRDEEDFVAAVTAFVGGRGLDKALDSTGASTLDRTFALMRKLGHIVSYGEAEGKPLPNLWERLVTKSLTFTRFHLGHADFASEAWRRSLEEVFGGAATGRIKVPIEETFAFDDAEAMLRRLASRQVAGKLILAVNPT
ncbi:NADPH2:quinone reductase [Roseiarcus fermentans]|uniref:NADPH2:quinone reductase n=1 Tax=Roseiarcus fermentans TaxID=1473586 RepID=A0A366FH64_9HYPH|nr:zinc-binding dehydrogenase [Roseiarcus fermentans]RBP13998.1 NADPH2:quinone reductase [Roseiarcus fermentans]